VLRRAGPSSGRLMMTDSSKIYSQTWFDLFLRPIPPAQTQREIAFLTRQLPPERFKTILDLCCGQGRHARELIQLGYVVTGVDANEHALAVARRSIGSAANWLCGDMRDLSALTQTRFDAVLCLWQSFGYFDDATNVSVLSEMTRALAPGGRLILDLYNRTFFQANQGTRTFETAGGKKVIETKELVGNRLRVRLTYESSAQVVDQFDWHLFTPGEISDLAATMGLRTVVACSHFDERSPVSDAVPRMQLVFER